MITNNNSRSYIVSSNILYAFIDPDDQYLSICEQVMREYGKMDQTIMHCIFVGPPGVGKSSLLKRLLRMKLDPNRTSTQAAEKSVRVEIIRDVSTTAAQVSGIDWQKLEDPISQASGLIGQLSTKQVMFEVEDLVSNPITQASQPIGQLSTKTFKDSTVGDLSFEQTDQDFKNDVLSFSEPLTSSQFSKTIDFFRHVWKEKGVSRLQQVNPCMDPLPD